MVSKKANDFDGEIKLCSVTQRGLAKALGVSAARVNQLIDEAIIIRDESSKAGRVLLFESLENWFLSKKASGDGVNFWKERSLHEKAKRELAELKLSERRGELYEAATVESALIELLTDFRTKLLGLGHKLSPRLEGLTAAQMADALDGEIEIILKELSEGVESATIAGDAAGSIEGTAASERDDVG